MYLCNEIIMNGITDSKLFVSPLKFSQSLSVIAERLFTFQPGLHPDYYVPVFTTALQRALQFRNNVLTNGLNVSFGS